MIMEDDEVAFSDTTVQKLFSAYQTAPSGVKTAIVTEDFREDVMRFMYITRILRRYVTHGNLNLPLLINHLIIVYNVFGETATEVLITYHGGLLHEISTVLFCMGRLPDSHVEYINLHFADVIEQMMKDRE